MSTWQQGGIFLKNQITAGWINFKLCRMTVMRPSSSLRNFQSNGAKSVPCIQTLHYGILCRPLDPSGKFCVCKWATNKRTHSNELFTHQVPLLCKLRIDWLVVNISLRPLPHHLLFRPQYLWENQQTVRGIREAQLSCQFSSAQSKLISMNQKSKDFRHIIKAAICNFYG